MKAVVLQPMYLPWMGYFGMIHQADTFVFYDDVQFSRDSWQQRNRVKIPESSGRTKWLKVPIIKDFGQDIKSVQIDNENDWRQNHWSILEEAYGPEPIPYGKTEAEHFKDYKHILKDIYDQEWKYIYELNIQIIRKITNVLDISKPSFYLSSNLDANGDGTNKLINVLQSVDADEYISGPGAKDYLKVSLFDNNDIKLYWHKFNHPKYKQLYGEFKSDLSIIDALFNTGDKTASLIREGESDALVREV